MEESWENWDLQMEMDHGNDFLDKCHTYDDDDDEFLRDILLQPSFSSGSDESDQYHHHHSSFHHATTTTVGSEVAVLDQMARKSDDIDSSNSSMSQQNNASNNNKRPRRSSSPRTYILSFDNSTMTPATPEPQPYPKKHDHLLKGSEGIARSSSNHSPNVPSKRAMAEPRAVADHSTNNNNNDNQQQQQQGAKKARNSSQTMDHIMAERKRRQELTERFIALSATIPGLSKTDKASILRAAIDYVKQLQERVQELEKQDKSKRSVVQHESVILVRKYDVCANYEQDTITTTTSSEETSSDECGTLPEIEARVMGKEVLVEIHCEKRNGIELKILDMLESLHLCVTGSSVLPFGNSALGITIIAQMGEAYKMTVNDLVKNLSEVLLKSSSTACNSDSC